MAVAVTSLLSPTCDDTERSTVARARIIHLQMMMSKQIDKKIVIYTIQQHLNSENA